MNRYLKLEGTITVREGADPEAFMDNFLEWVDSAECGYTGSYVEVDENGNELPLGGAVIGPEVSDFGIAEADEEP